MNMEGKKQKFKQALHPGNKIHEQLAGARQSNVPCPRHPDISPKTSTRRMAAMKAIGPLETGIPILPYCFLMSTTQRMQSPCFMALKASLIPDSVSRCVINS